MSRHASHRGTALVPAEGVFRPAVVSRSIDFRKFDAALGIPGTVQLPLSSDKVRVPHVSAWHIASQMEETELAFGRAIANGCHTYIHQTQIGVGATILLKRLVDGFNFVQHAHASAPTRVAYISLGAQQRSAGKLLDLMGHALGCPISGADLRLRAFGRVMAMLMDHATRLRVVGFVFDHLHYASHDTLSLLAEAALLTDPAYRTTLLVDDVAIPAAPIALIFVGSTPPEELADRTPELAAAIGAVGAQMAPLNNTRLLREAIEVALSVNSAHWDHDEEAVLQEVLDDTRGLSAYLRPLLHAAAMLRSDDESLTLCEALRQAMKRHSVLPPFCARRKVASLQGTPSATPSTDAGRSAPTRSPRCTRAREKRELAEKAKQALSRRRLKQS